MKKEWDVTGARLTKSMENIITYTFNFTIPESHSLLTKLLHVCIYLPKQDRERLKEHFPPHFQAPENY